jgi:potassium-transporting ATPase ATP-binding subunit
MADRKATPLWERQIVMGALTDSLRKFDPRIQARNPVMFVVEVTALAVTLILFRDFFAGHNSLALFELQIAI